MISMKQKKIKILNNTTQNGKCQWKQKQKQWKGTKNALEPTAEPISVRRARWCLHSEEVTGELEAKSVWNHAQRERFFSGWSQGKFFPKYPNSNFTTLRFPFIGKSHNFSSFPTNCTALHCMLYHLMVYTSSTTAPDQWTWENSLNYYKNIFIL